MISFIKGTVADIETDKLVVECNNIGYNIFVPISVIDKVNRTGTEVKLYTYLSVKEDSITLFGFLNRDELKLFRQMISVSGIGPKGALGILSTLSVENLKIAIISGDSKAIAKSPGIGAKTASKLILELKDKLDISSAFEDDDSGADLNNSNINGSMQGDATDALVALGYSPAQAFSAIKEANKHNKDIKDVSELIKNALKFIK